MTALNNLIIEMATNIEEAKAITELFISNADPSYISHTELQGGRAISETEWSDKIEEIIYSEAVEIIQDQGNLKYILLAKMDAELIGVAFIEFYPNDNYAVIEDMIVKRNFRSSLIGKQLMDWIEQDVKARGITRIFLESGIHNEQAHKFIERSNFHVVSKVFMKILE